jgi:hypothetical protein
MDARPCFILLVLWDSYYSCDDTTCVHVFSSMPRFKTVFGSYLLPFVLQIVHVIFMLIVFIFANSCLTRYPYQMMLMSFNSNTTSTTGRARNNNPSRAHEFNAVVLYVGVLLLLPLCYIKVNNICNRNCFPFQNTSGCFRSYVP